MKSTFRMLMVVAGILAGASFVYAEDPVIKDGSKVAFDFVITVDDKVVDSSQARGPLEYTQGEGTPFPALTKQMAGMKVGEEKVIVLKPEEAYGNPDPSGIREMPLTSVPTDIKPQVGMILQMQDEAGKLFPARITEIKKDTMVIDLNHPLAGKTLNFKVRVVSIN